MSGIKAGIISKFRSAKAACVSSDITGALIGSSVTVATGGLMFGFDVGVSGGVTSMDPFLRNFFPGVYHRNHQITLNNNYCKYDDQFLQLFTSSLYLAALVSSLFLASHTTRRLGRRYTMLISGMFLIIGVILNASAINLGMLIAGRLLLGCGIGLANQAVPLFLSEIAPTRLRGFFNIMFQLMITIGILIAQVINYFTNGIDGGWGWRVSLGCAGFPALIFTLGVIFLEDTPNSLIERGYPEKGKEVLRRIRGTDNVEAEYNEIVHASQMSRHVKHPFRNLLKRSSRPQLVIAIMMQFFQQFTGINAIMFYAPVLFNTLGFKNNASLISAAITGAVNVLSTLVSNLFVDRIGRRPLLIMGGLIMFLAQVAIGVTMGTSVTDSSEHLSKGLAVIIIALVCTFVSSFAWSWGPLGWLIPSETFPLETRSAGQSITVSMNMLFTFVIGQAFLSMLCHLKYGIFFFFAGWVFIMTLCVMYFIPETSNVPIEQMKDTVWKEHPFWRRFIDDNEGLPISVVDKDGDCIDTVTGSGNSIDTIIDIQE